MDRPCSPLSSLILPSPPPKLPLWTSYPRSFATAGVPISDGQFCLIGSGGGFGRYNVSGTDRNSLGMFDAAGILMNLVGTGGPTGFGFDVPLDIEIAGSPPATIMAGDTYHFQLWYRDTFVAAGHSNFSNGISVTF